MASTSTPPNSGKLPGEIPPPKDPGKLRSFWQSVTDGFELQELWGQFKSEAREGYALYSKDVDWDEVKKQRSGFKRWLYKCYLLFRAMLMKLTPARRVLLLVAVVLVMIHPDIQGGKHGETYSFDFVGVGAAILFVLLALELADRVTMKRDLEIAREIQQWLVPHTAPAVAGFDIAFATRPQNTVAGDYYDAFLRAMPGVPAEKAPLLVAVADVAGKSVPAALLMATFQSGLKALASTPATLGEVVTGLDRYARAHSLEGQRFTTAFLAEIDPRTRAMRYTNCGHNDPILRRASGEIVRLAVGGPPLGLPLFSDDEIAYGAETVQLIPGDLLFIFTDGLVEAVNEKGDEFKESRLISSIAAAASGSAAQILASTMSDVNEFVGYARQHDDITALVLRVS
jgi:sigma-B regulation protein RsbU (phosphoserine phosphatase)